jgi:DNA-binding NarL/FixJ family response regulator
MTSRPARSLTEMERLVLSFSATGLGTVEVAEQLGLPPDEVRRHLRAAILALGAQSKLEAVVFAAREGLIRLP